MLIDDFLAFRSGLKYPDGTSHDREVDRYRANLNPSVFVLDRDAIGMAVHAALSKPSTIVDSLRFLRLPFQDLWIEWSPQDARDGYSSVGSPNIKPPAAVDGLFIERAAFRLREERTDQSVCITIDYVHKSLIGGKSYIDVSPAQGRFEFSLGRVYSFDTPPIGFQGAPIEKVTGRMKDYQKTIARSPEEYRALKLLHDCFDWEPIAEMGGVRKAMIKMMGEERVRSVELNQADEMLRHFTMIVLPAIILLNCRNAVRVDKNPIDEKLQKSRRKSGKLPLRDYATVKLALRPSHTPVATGGKRESAAQNVSHIVRGHFKTRETGVFWWSPFMRGGARTGRSVTPFQETRYEIAGGPKLGVN